MIDDSDVFKDYTKDLKGQYYKIKDNPDMVLYESPSVCNKLFRKEIIGNYRFIPGVMWEDVAFSYSRLIKADNILIMNNLDYFYRRDISRGVSGTNYRLNPHVFDIIKVAYEIENETIKCGKYDEFKKQVKFLQMATCLQRIVEIENWQTSEILSIKNKLYQLILDNFGDLSDVDEALLSSRVPLRIIDEFKQFSLENLEVRDENCHSL